MPICAYEDIYYIILKVDKEYKYQLKKKQLAYEVKKQSGNITQTLVALYCEHVSGKRVAHKQRKRSMENNTISAENERQKKIKREKLDVFRRKATRWTAKSLIQNETGSLLDRKMPAIHNEGKN